MNSVLTTHDYELLILISLFLVKFKLNDVINAICWVLWHII